MRRARKRFSAVAFLLVFGLAAAVSASPDTTVYVTKTGKKYHTATCQYLKQSKIPMKLKDAKKRYTACSRCKPAAS